MGSGGMTHCSSSCRNSGFIFSRSGCALRFVWVSGFSTIRNSSSSCDTSKLALLICDGACQYNRRLINTTTTYIRYKWGLCVLLLKHVPVEGSKPWMIPNVRNVLALALAP